MFGKAVYNMLKKRIDPYLERHCCIERRHHHGQGDLPVGCRTERSHGRPVRL